jgi:hypothetical protein
MRMREGRTAVTRRRTDEGRAAVVADICGHQHRVQRAHQTEGVHDEEDPHVLAEYGHVHASGGHRQRHAQLLLLHAVG